MQRPIAVNTWVWESPLTDANLPPLLARIADMGFDAVELPLENVGDLSAAVVRDALGGLSPLLVGAMAPGRELVLADDAVITRTQHYLSACIRLAHDIGAPAVCGPFYARTGRVWRIIRLMPDGRILIDSYHCSRYNQNTGRLTQPMFEAVFERALQLRDGVAA